MPDARRPAIVSGHRRALTLSHQRALTIILETYSAPGKVQASHTPIEHNTNKCTCWQRALQQYVALCVEDAQSQAERGYSQELASRGPGDCEGPSPSEALLKVGSWAVKGCPL